MSYLTYEQILTRLDAIVTNPANSTFLRRVTLPGVTPEGRTITGIEFGLTSNPNPVKVLIVGGLHAREWAPPEALIELCEVIANAYRARRSVVDTGFTWSSSETDPADGAHVGRIRFGNAVITAPEIINIIRRLKLVIIPSGNPDGRTYSVTPAVGLDQKQRMGWRTNRRLMGACASPPPPHMPAPPENRGVDLNRNFPIGWDWDVYYSAAAVANQATGPAKATTEISCDHTEYRTFYDGNDPSSDSDVYGGYKRRSLYKGPSAQSEPETQSLITFIESMKPSFFLDVHAYDRSIFKPWGLAKNGNSVASQSYLNSALNRIPGGGRDPFPAPPAVPSYFEYFPGTIPGIRYNLEREMDRIGALMKSRVLISAGADRHARNRMKYAYKPSSELYPTTGTIDDWVFSKQFRWNAATSQAEPHPDWFPVHSFCMEAGALSDGGFWPSKAANQNQYRKVRREIWFGIVGMLRYATNWRRP